MLIKGVSSSGSALKRSLARTHTGVGLDNLSFLSNAVLLDHWSFLEKASVSASDLKVKTFNESL